MHELSLALSLIETVKSHAEKKGPGRISMIEMSIGAMSGVDREALEFALEQILEVNKIKDCELLIHEVPISVFCKKCNATTSRKDIIILCPICESDSVELVDGTDFKLLSLELTT